MLGKTHTSIGLAVVTKFFPGLMVPVFTGFSGSIVFITSILATIAGSLAPDMDHPGSKASRGALMTDTIGRIMTIILGVGIAVAAWYFDLPMGFSIAGGVLVLLGVAMFSLAEKILPMENIERVGMIIVGLLLLYFNYLKHYHPVLNIFGFAYLLFGILRHRGLTHSLLGWLLASTGWYLLAKAFPFVKFTVLGHVLVIPLSQTLLPFVVGYGAHLLADLMADTGFALFYPWKQKFKAPVTITTRSMVDHLIGIVAIALFFALEYSHIKG